MTEALPAPPGPAGSSSWPPVSVVMPVLNEEQHLRGAVEHVLRQRYPGPLELVVALGPSTDATDSIAAQLVAEHPHVVRTVPNPSGATPAALNAAVGAASHDVLVRVDGHAYFPDDYVRVAVETLLETGADNVGGIMAAEGITPFEQAVARAMTSPLGVGSARFHTGGEAGPAETVYLGVFRRSALERVGGFDESFLRAQDWEMNHRIRETGGLVWFTPRLRVSYRPRSSLRRLARQYFDYGQWRRGVARRHPDTLSVRYLAPPTAVVAVAVGSVAAVAGTALGPRFAVLRTGALLPAGYVALVAVGSAVTGHRLPARSWAWLPAVYATMHGAWGAGFLLSPHDPGAAGGSPRPRR